jgi:hypothetical protein
MAQKRAFSFSDNSADVAFPRITGASATPTTPTRLWLQTFDCALDVFRLRQLQSRFYQDIFQTAREPWTMPYSYIWQCWQKLNEWYQALSPSIPDSYRTLLGLELLYSYVYLLTPSPKVPVICELAQSLVFEYCIECIDQFHSGLSNPTTRPWFNVVDAIRIYMVGRHFLDTLEKYQDRILAGLLPDPANLPPAAAPPPPYPFPQRVDNMERSFDCISKTQSILNTFGIRFGFMEWRDTFQKDSDMIVQGLVTQNNRRYSTEHQQISESGPQTQAYAGVNQQYQWDSTMTAQRLSLPDNPDSYMGS